MILLFWNTIFELNVINLIAGSEDREVSFYTQAV